MDFGRLLELGDKKTAQNEAFPLSLDPSCRNTFNEGTSKCARRCRDR